MSNSQLLAEYAQLHAELEQVRAQFLENYRAQPKQEDYSDSSAWLKALRERTERSQAISQAELDLGNRINLLNQALISLALSLLEVSELPDAEISQQLRCDEHCSAEISAAIQRFVTKNLSYLSAQEGQRSKPTAPVPFPGQ